MRSIYIALPEQAADQLRVLATREYRSPRQQAAILLNEGLRRAGHDVDLASRERAALTVGEVGRP
jgi:hypothetical protein